VLIEFADLTPMHLIERMVSRLAKRGLLAVIAHPERYRSLWSDRAPLHRLLDLGCAALLDSCALVGKYGKAPKKTAIALLREGAYHGACSDAHRSTDIPLVREALAALSRLVGQEEAAFLLSTGPASLLSGRLPPDLLG
jgi:protein-tyrosine phosphatase